MRILLSNDDGYFAPGLAALYEALLPFADLTVVAPERDKSGASNSLTLDRPLSIRKSPNGFYFVNGTPTDCVHMAVTGMIDFVPDMVVSGINSGSNMGDTIYSGTVAAATELPAWRAVDCGVDGQPRSETLRHRGARRRGTGAAPPAQPADHADPAQRQRTRCAV
jgi:hypothetical protein